MRHVIIGGSIAAASAIAAITAKDRDAEITVVSQERPFYFRPLIPNLLEGSRSLEDISYLAGVKGVARLVSDSATGLDTGGRKVRLASGAELEYDRLLIATGGLPQVPDIPGAENVFTLRTAADALAIKKAAFGLKVKEALIIGGGLVGIKAALALGKLGLGVTIVERLGQLLYPRLDFKGASIIRERLEKSGIGIIAGEEVREISNGRARLGLGAEVSAPLVVAAVGTSPNTGWLKGSRLESAGGLLVDDNLMTPVKDVFAAGDCMSFADTVSGRMITSALWTNAVETGRTAGTNMAGGRTVCPGIWQVLNATEICGVPMVSSGITEAAPEEEVYAHEGPDGYRKLIFEGARLKGALFLGEIKGAGVYTSLIRNRTALSEVQKQKAIRATLGYADFAMAGARY